MIKKVDHDKYSYLGWVIFLTPDSLVPISGTDANLYQKVGNDDDTYVYGVYSR